jgi:hypothetical protein
MKRRFGLHLLEFGASKAALLVKSGHPYPVHFDLIVVAGEYSETYRMSFVDAAIVRQLDKLNEPMDSPSNLVVTGHQVHIRNRPKGVLPHFVIRLDEI